MTNPEEPRVEPPVRDRRDRIVADPDLATQILVAGAAMVGVSLTLVGLLRIVQSLSPITTLADNILAGASIVFLFACLAAYLALRAKTPERARFWLGFADRLFIAGLMAMVVLGTLLAIELL